MKSTALGFGILAAMATAAAAAPPVYDEILVYGYDHQSNYWQTRAPLPGGPPAPLVAAPGEIFFLYQMPGGPLLATTRDSGHTVLNELRADSSLRQIGEVAPLPDATAQFEYVLDMDIDQHGRLYLLIWYLPADVRRLVEIDPETAATRRSLPVEAEGIATAPDGLWALVDHQLRKLDPDSLYLGPPVAAIPHYAGNFEADSAGRLYFATQVAPCIPDCLSIGRVDPATGIVEPGTYHLLAGLHLVTFTVRRRCVESATARCLQGGRFRAEVSFTDPADGEGAAMVANARTGESGVFSFFEPDNWEVMVKVLDGCALNSHFWVYSSASTDVAFTMTVTDTETGAQRVYTNPPGQAAVTVTDISAFSCTL